MSVSVILTTTPDDELAEQLASDLIESKLAACVQVSSPIQSTYRWKGKVEQTKEYQLWIKTTSDKVEPVIQAIQAKHSYELPEILSFSATSGLPAYLEWVKKETH